MRGAGTDRPVVVLPVLDVVPAHDFNFTDVGILLPLRDSVRTGIKTSGKKGTYVEEVNLLEELLLVVLELANHGAGESRRGRERGGGMCDVCDGIVR